MRGRGRRSAVSQMHGESCVWFHASYFYISLDAVMHSGQDVWLRNTCEEANKVIIVKNQLDVAVPMSVQELVEVLPYLHVVAGACHMQCGGHP